ncbi:MAG: GDSL-type esterase/lipase family protein [Rhodothermales bacterium]|nr:GDSL-type esterase/lipase family protein [Rhodothermales bacterium]
MRPRLSKCVLLLALVGGGLVLALGLAEGAVRLAAPQDLDHSISWYQAHPVYRFRHRAGLDRRAKWFTYYHLRTNARGLRGAREIPYDPAGRWRVLIHGDSFTFGNGLDEDDLFATRTERLLHQRGLTRAQVVNMGVSASGTSLQYLYFREEGRRYRPNVVVIAVFLGNDFLDDARDGAFTLEEGRLVEQPFEVPLAKRLTDTGLYQFFAARSHLLVFVRDRFTRLPGAQDDEAAAYTDARRFPARYALNEAVLLRFVEAAEAEGAVPVVLLLPTPWQLLSAHGRPADGDYFPLAERYREALLETCRAQALRCLDATPALAAATADPWRLFLHDAEGQADFHYNADAHAVVATLLTDTLAGLYGAPSEAPTP